MKNFPCISPLPAILGVIGAALVGLLPPSHASGEESARIPFSPVSIPNLICFWDFREAGAGGLASKGRNAYILQEMNGPIVRVAQGIFGTSSLKIERGQWLRIPREQCPALNIHGRQEVTVVAWLQRQGDQKWQYLAGMWDERGRNRQYALFTSGHKQTDYTTLERTDAHHQTHGYVSDVGGATPGKPFCFSYATGKRMIPANEWQMLAFTFDTKTLRVYHDGELDANGNSNPFPWDKPIFDAGEKGADFTIAQRDHPKWPSYPEGAIAVEEGFSGLLGGLAVYGRALSDEELRRLFATTMKHSPLTRP